MSCDCGTCACKGKAVIDQDEYDGLVEAAEPNIELRSTATQVIAAAKEHKLPDILQSWINQLDRSLNL